ncbi:NAD(P)-binding protein, partial [Basidiobolus meristosporus CBS 931.73]
ITVALAGGSGGLGRYILDELLSQGKHRVVILAREPRPDLEKLGATVAVVDYANSESLLKALQGVHTVLSFIWSDDGGLKDAQIELLKAAERAGVKRFAPSEWALDSVSYDDVPQYADKKPIRELLSKSSIESTLFFNGLFLNYFGKEKGYLREVNIVYDVEKGTAVIPGTGEEPLSVTHTTDVARYVVASLEQPKWRPITGIEGERTTFNKILHSLERATGKAS